MSQIQEDLIDVLTGQFALDRANIKSVVELIQGGATVPFIARYRKEKIGSMDESVIRALLDQYSLLLELKTRKRTVIKGLRKNGRLTPDLEERINACDKRADVEDLYRPYKPRKQASEQEATGKGLGPFANELLDMGAAGDPRAVAEKAVGALGDGMTPEDAFQGIAEIAAGKVAEHVDVRGRLKELAKTEGLITSKAREGKEDKSSRFTNYNDFSEKASEIPAHRMLALRRGEKEGLLKVDLEFDRDKMLDIIRDVFSVESDGPMKEFMEAVIKDAADRLLKPLISNEVRAEAKRRADEESIQVFCENLREILLSPPAGECVVIGVDPGAGSGSRLAVVDEKGSYIESASVFLTGPDSKPEEAAEVLRPLIEKHKPSFVAVGNGSVSRAAEKALRKVLSGLDDAPPVAVVNESGISVYAASELCKEEFPNLDIAVRGAVSMARRLKDPLVELVKVDPRSIGVGQYQYDVNQTMLRRRLSEVVESCVTIVAVDVNSASVPLLSYVPGIGSSIARAVVEHRNQHGPFLNRARLLDVKGIGPRAFEQCAGFLTIKDSEIPLECTTIHPESYYVVEKISCDLEKTVEELMRSQELLDGLDPEKYVDDKTGLPTVKDIIDELKTPARDPRGRYKEVSFKSDVTDIDHMEEGMVLEGRVSNITRFGVFVDIGVFQDGLVHISEISSRFVSDPRDVLKVGQVVKVRVIGVKKDKGRISLSIKAADAPPKRPRPKQADRKASPGRKPKELKKSPPRREEKLRTLDDLLNRFGDPHKKK